MIGDCIQCPAQNTRIRRQLCNRCYLTAWRRDQRPAQRIYRRWTEQEHNYVLFNLGYQSIPVIAHKINRSPSAVLRYTQAQRFRAKSTIVRSRGMSTIDVSRALGVSHYTIITWIHRGWLHATKVHAVVQWYYSISEEQIVAFLAERGGLFDLRPIGEWCEIVETARMQLEQRYISRKMCMELFCLADSTINNLINRHQFPLVALHIPTRGHWYERSAVREWLCAHPYWQTRAAAAAGLCD